jgi:hypothetical protein
MPKKSKNRLTKSVLSPVVRASVAPRKKYLWKKTGVALLLVIISLVAFFGIPGLQSSHKNSSEPSQGLTSNLINGMAESCAYAANCSPEDALVKVLDSASTVPGMYGNSDAIVKYAEAAVKYTNSIEDGAASLKAGRGLFGASPQIEKSLLNESQLTNLRRFEKKIGSTPYTLHQAKPGLAFSAEVPGKVPGSKAIYEKVVDKGGNTMSFTKTTYTPEGKIVHIKDKIDESITISFDE